jgi:hypothetical protein
MRLDGDALGVDLGAPPEGLLDPALDLDGGQLRLHPDQVGDALDAPQPTDRRLRPLPLVVPPDLAIEGDVANLGDHLDTIRSASGMAFRRVGTR